MIRTALKVFVTFLIALGLFAPGVVGKAEAKAKRHKKVGFFTRVKRAVKHKVKMTAKKVRRNSYKAAANAKNALMDGCVKAKSSITGKRPKKVWRKGHYKKGNKRHTSGHWARNKKHSRKSSGRTSLPPSAPLPTSAGDPALPY